MCFLNKNDRQHVKAMTKRLGKMICRRKGALLLTYYVPFLMLLIAVITKMSSKPDKTDATANLDKMITTTSFNYYGNNEYHAPDGKIANFTK